MWVGSFGIEEEAEDFDIP
jgi:hypothetical protein